MGNTTYKSFGAKPLPNRLHIIITRDKEKVLNDYLHKMALFAELKETDDIPWDTNVMYAVSLENALDLARNHNYVHQCDKEIFIIGGAQIFDLAKNLSTENMVQKLYITEVDVELGEGNFAKFQYDELLWKEVDRIENVSDEKNKYNHTFKTLDRVVNIIGI
jgi:dihydrofolate reductase